MPYMKIVTYYLNHSLLLTHITPFFGGEKGQCVTVARNNDSEGKAMWI